MSNPVKPVKILRASAGSGKTFTITSCYLELLFSSGSDKKYQEILAVTFTNKATEEMKSRILLELKRLAEVDPKSPYKEILIKQNPEFNVVSLAEKAKKIYRRILHDYGRFSVITIDSFVQRIIRSFATEFGLEPGFKVEINTQKVRNDLIYTLGKELNTNKSLLDYCIRLVLDRLKNNKKWDYQMDLKELADHIFQDDFQEFEKSLEIILETQSKEEFFSGIQSKNEQIIRSFESGIKERTQKAISIFDDFKLDTEDFKSKSTSPLVNLNKNFGGEVKDWDMKKIKILLKKVDHFDDWFQKNKENQDFFNALNPALKEIQFYYKSNVSDYLFNKSLKNNLSLLRPLLDLTRILKTYREETGDLLISDAQRLLEGITHPESGNPSFIWEKIGNRYRNFLLDEFQDTSQMQWNNFRPLLEESISIHEGKRVENLIVGDVKQSIYRWRNGDYELLYKKVLSDLGAQSVSEGSLERNYRSRENIIKFNNILFGVIPGFVQRELNRIINDTENPDLESWWKDRGYDFLLIDIYKESNQNIPSEAPTGGNVKLAIIKNTEDVDDEGLVEKKDFKSRLIRTSIQEVQRLTREENFSYSDFCILVRTHNEVAIVLNAFLESGIPVVSGDALIIGNQRAIEILVLALRYLLGPEKNAHYYLSNLIILYSEWKDHPFPAEAFQAKGNDSPFLPSEFLSSVKELVQLPLSELYERLIEIFHLDEKKGDIPYLLGFRDLLAGFNQNGEEGLSRFLSWWDEEGAFRGLSSGNLPNAVQISTIHKSKGLAYRAVFVPFAGWNLKGFSGKDFWISTQFTEYESLGKIPIRFQDSLGDTTVAKDYFKELLDSSLDAINELYVALTRARDYIFISYKHKKKRYNKDIGDFIHLTLDSLGSLGLVREDVNENEFYILGFETIFPKVNNPVNFSEKPLSINTYPYSKRLGDRNNSLDSKNRFKMDEATERGRLFHEILSRMENLDELDRVILDLRNQGNFLKKEEESIKLEITRILNHPELKQLHDGAYKYFKERTLLLKGGDQYRPDKVILKEKETLIVDYKFTQAPQPEHRTQVKNYGVLLSRMNYPQIRTFLYYHFNQSLIEVY